MPDLYTNETVELVADAMLAVLNAWDEVPDDKAINERALGLAVTRAVLNALAGAGLLIEPDGKVTWAINEPDFPDVFICCESEEQARRRADKWPHVKLLRSGTAPWVEVPRG